MILIPRLSCSPSPNRFKAEETLRASHPPFVKTSGRFSMTRLLAFPSTPRLFLYISNSKRTRRSAPEGITEAKHIKWTARRAYQGRYDVRVAGGPQAFVASRERLCVMGTRFSRLFYFYLF